MQEDLLKEKSGIHLDIGCGKNKQPNFVGMDIRDLPGVDLVWDWSNIPYPLPNGCCISILASHVVEHINPADFGFIKVMNEWHRLLRPNGRAIIVTPYAGSTGYWQDPTHINGVNERTMAYFDPDYELYKIYEPLPWKIVKSVWDTNGNLEVVLEKRGGNL